VLAESAVETRIRKSGPGVRQTPEAEHDLMAGGRHQTNEVAQRRFSTARLVGADDALGRVSPAGDIGLREAPELAGPPEQFASQGFLVHPLGL